MTGQQLYNFWQVRIDSSYTGYLDPIKATAMYRQTMLVCSDKKYLSLEDQKTFDELSVQLISGIILSVNNNQVFTAPSILASIVANAGTYTVVTTFSHNLILSDSVTFQGLTGGYAPLNGLTFPLTGTVSNTSFTFQTGALTIAPLLNTGSFTFSKMISDYMHLDAIRCKFSEPVTQRIVATSGISPISIRYGARTQIRSGMQIVLTGMTNPNANGTWYAKQINNTVYDLYTNPDLTTPSTGGTTTNGVQGATSILWYEYATPLFNDRQIDPYERATPSLPKYETTEKFLRFHPTNKTCSEITIDYTKLPPIFIDASDNTIDLTGYYPEKYLMWINDVMIKLFTTGNRDILERQMINEEIITNK